MVIKRKLMVIIFVAIGNCIFAQTEVLQTLQNDGKIILNTVLITNVKYLIYSPPFEARAIYTDISQVKNSYPEELMSSILCANNQDWVDFNTLGGNKKSEKLSKKEFQEVKNMNVDATYFELIAKLEFIANNSKMTIIKFNFHSNKIKKPMVGAIALQQVDGVWKKTSSPYLSKISMIMLVFKADVLKRLLESKSENEYEKSIIEKVGGDNGIDFGKLLEINLDEKGKELLTNPLNW
jgi:hypothetical protein